MLDGMDECTITYERIFLLHISEACRKVDWFSVSSGIERLVRKTKETFLLFSSKSPFNLPGGGCVIRGQ